MAEPKRGRGRPKGVRDSKPRKRRTAAEMVLDEETTEDRAEVLGDAARKLKADADVQERKAEQLRLKLEQEAGRLVPIEAMRERDVERIQELKTNFSSLAARISDRLAEIGDSRQAHDLLMVEFESLCREFASA